MQLFGLYFRTGAATLTKQCKWRRGVTDTMDMWPIRGRLTSDGTFPSPTIARIAGAVITVSITAVALARNPAQAQTCPDADDPPTPTEVAVTAVPIVVTSTTADYFVLYATHDVDGETMEYPV